MEPSAPDVTGLIDAVEEQGRALLGSAERAGPQASIPDLTRWRVRNLLRHIGSVHRWAATYVREGPDAVHGGVHPPTPHAPAEDTALLGWCSEGLTALVAALRAAPADLDAWTFIPGSTPREFWARRQAHETAIHRADADRALGLVPEFAPAFAADGIDELFSGFWGRRSRKLLSDPPVSLVVRPDDADRSWRMNIGPDDRTITSPAGDERPADCTLGGPAGDLYLFLWNRTPRTPPRVDGDPAVLDLWRRNARIVWS